ncbi:hypothetical protein [Rhizobium leguminosarum]|nr:hypothetical protein [Rhizobium leguminosarum]
MSVERAVVAFLIAVAIACMLSALVGCVSYKPPGQDLWRAL